MQTRRRPHPVAQRTQDRDRKRPVVILLALVALISISIIGTLAYFTDSRTADNTFTVGKVEIELNEPKWKAANNHTNPPILIPGKDILKDPTVTVKQGSEDCYVRVKLVMPAALKTVLEEIEVDTVNWTKINHTTVAGTYTVYYNYKDMVQKANSDKILNAVFGKVTPRTDATAAEWKAVRDLGTGKAKITVTAEAIQSQGFTGATDAWASFPTTP